MKLKYLYVVAGGMLIQHPVVALTVTGYTSEDNDRFVSGYPTAPVENTSESFVGTGLDWGGVGWSSNTVTKSFGFLSPKHYLVARHFGGSTYVRIFANETLQTYTQSGIEATGYGTVFSGETLGDISLGTLTTAIPSSGGLPRYAVLDLNSASGSNTTAAYLGLEVLLYGRGPDSSYSTRVGETTINSVTVSGNNQYFTTARTEVQLEGGDSGSPAIHRWLNPDGQEEITLVGNHAAINDTTNFINFLGTYQVMNKLNEFMNDDGFALKVVGNSAKTWVGSSSTSIANKGAWGIKGGLELAPSDKFVTFDAATAGNNQQVTVDTNHNLRGLYFKSTGTADDGFTFGGSSTLTLGRGGITNYDSDRQVFNAPLALGDAQYWDGGAGGITVAGTLNTNGKLLETTGSGENLISGLISGTGALAISGGTLELTAGNSYSGNTWAHSGTLKVNNVSGSATGFGTVTVASGATLAGAGIISGATTISGAIAPGNSIGTLTIQNDVTWNAGDFWLFELALAANTLSGAGSGTSTQDMLDITGNFLKGSGSGWAFDFSGTGDLGWYRLIDWSTDTTFAAEDFLASNLANDYTGSFSMDSGSLYLQVIPEPVSMVLLGPGLLMVFGYRGWRRQGSGIFGLKAPQAVPQERMEDDCPEPLLCWHDWMLRQQWKVEGIQNRYDRCLDRFWARVAMMDQRFQLWRMRRRAG